MAADVADRRNAPKNDHVWAGSFSTVSKKIRTNENLPPLSTTKFYEYNSQIKQTRLTSSEVQGAVKNSNILDNLVPSRDVSPIHKPSSSSHYQLQNVSVANELHTTSLANLSQAISPRDIMPVPKELSTDETDGYSTVDDKSERDGEFKLPRREKKKEKSKKKGEEKERKSDEKKKSEKKKKDKENPEVEAMDEEVPDEAGRGTTKRTRTSNEASDEDNNGKDELLKELADQKELMRHLFEATKTREAQYDERLVKKGKEIAQLRAEITELKDAMVKSQKQGFHPDILLAQACQKPVRSTDDEIFISKMFCEVARKEILN
uniref:Protein split ends-like n=1 Tax=Diabrotica virgifera virgifera TaxID=50390 RepID=A0A6P7GDR0_DIAVI